MRRISRSARGIASAVAAVALAGVAAACGSYAGGSEGEGDYPRGRLSIMAPADPGGGWDETARALQQAVRESELADDGTEVYNVPGAGGTLGLSQLVSKSSGEPNQLMVMGLVMLGAIETNQSPVDLGVTTPIATLTTEAEVIVVPSDSEYRTLDDLTKDLERDPGSVAWGGGSAGGTDQLLVGLLAKEVGANPAETKYVAHEGGGEATAAILSGSVDVGVSGVSEFADYVKAGEMRALAVSGEGPLEVGGEKVENLTAQGYDVTITNWRGIVGPPGLSDEQRDQIVEYVERVQATPAWKANIKRFGWTELAKSGEAFRQFLDSEEQRVKQIVADLELSGS
jgi:putative tricarboxylic transport membrane protein